MTDGAPGPDGSNQTGPHTPSPGNVRPTGPGPLVGLGSVAAVVGWSIRPLSIHFDAAVPVISVWSVVVIWVLAVAVGVVAFRTWRLLQRAPGALRDRTPLEPYQAVNRLVLGKAAALAGAVVLGGYAGFAIAHLGIAPTQLSGQRLLRAAIAAAGGLALLVAGLLLERACRVRSEAP
ncbi:MAG: hypothetical protein JWO46_1540 [Nocardioidaceae bacterium]|nr:hypothetical protein [Nocardioidaceae bacterium]